LVTVDEKSRIVRLVHYTTQEYFERTQERWVSSAEADITAICVTYLSFTVFGSGICHTDSSFEERLSVYPLYDYSAHYWGEHAGQASSLCPKVFEFLQCTIKVEAAAQAMLVRRFRSSHSNYSQKVPRQMNGLHIAAYFGVTELVAVIFQSDEFNLDSKSSYGRTPLSWAAERGHEAVVKWLLSTGKVDVDSKGSSGRTPLSWAAESGHEAVVKLLLDTGKVNIDLKSGYSKTPLSWASEEGHKAVVKLLFDTGRVDFDSKDGDGRTLLLWAAERGHQAVIKLLQPTITTALHT
jgi:ankyrin repeat protein